MEYPHIGKHCSVEICRRLDFLPVRCDACEQIFCSNHMTYVKHNCPSSHKKDVQVPVCPLCNKPVPSQRGTLPDIAVGNHIDNDCQSDKAQRRKKVFTNKCSLKGCKIKEVVPVICPDCRQNYCFKHRHSSDHDCVGIKTKTFNAAIARQKQNTRSHHVSVLQGNGNMSEDEALARALQRSLETEQDTSRSNLERRQQQNCRVS